MIDFEFGRSNVKGLVSLVDSGWCAIIPSELTLKLNRQKCEHE